MAQEKNPNKISQNENQQQANPGTIKRILKLSEKSLQW